MNSSVPSNDAPRPALRVPEVTAYFWLIKLLTTAMGEATSDALVHAMAPAAAVGLGFVGFSISLAVQFSMRRYVAWAYWFAVAMVGVFGTMAADVLHVGLRVPYVASSALYAFALAAVFMTWQSREKTLSFHTIDTPQREGFYWAAVVATFALGTAAGDLSAVTFHLGYFFSGVAFAGVMLVPAVGYSRFGLNPIVAFWFAYVVTRPLGASIADWVGKPQSLGGLGLGAAHLSVILAAVITALVARLAATRQDVQRSPSFVGEPALEEKAV